MIPQEIIAEIKNKSNIVEVIGSSVSLKKVGDDYKGKCPFHDEKTPSFSVSPEKSMYKCFGCGKSGNVITFVMENEKVTFGEACKKLAERYFIEIPENKKKREYKKPEPPVKKEIPALKKWFFDRGITEQTLSKFGVTFSNVWMPKAAKETDTVCFNYFRNGDLVNIKYRAAQKDFKLAKDAELIFYNLDSIQGRDCVIIVEGEIDCMTVSQCMNYNVAVVSVPNGAATGTQRLEYFDNCYEYFEQVAQVIIFTDNDNPGILLRDELARRIGYDKCFKVIYPADCKDANEILLKHGQKGVLECIKYAVEFPIEGILSMQEMYEDIRNYYHHGYPIGIKVGIPEFDEHISFMVGQFTTVTGIPGSGKSEFIDWVMVNAAQNHGWRVGICSFENQPSSLHVTKLMEKHIGKSFSFRSNPYDRMSENEMNIAATFIDEYFHFININQVDVTIDGLLTKAAELVMRKGVKMILIDPWNYIEHKINVGQTETQYISESLSKFKSFCLKYGVHLILVAHPVKMKKENNKYEVPTLYSISGSSHFFNKTDNGITVYRDYDTGVVDVYIQKVRYSWLGKVGRVSFTYNVDTRQYQNAL